LDAGVLAGERDEAEYVPLATSDLVDIGANEAAIELGDEAVLFGPGGPALPDVAAAAGTISYELCCRVAPRVPRIYLEPGPK
jgi:alanine racemase